MPQSSKAILNSMLDYRQAKLDRGIKMFVALQQGICLKKIR
jgi:hypothetical protein